MYKENYGSFNEALNHKDGLVVLAIFYEVCWLNLFN
jgi:hypothetical protein